MPIVRIDIQAGKSTAYKRAILHGVRTAVTKALGVGDDRVTQRLIETPAEESFCVGGVTAGQKVVDPEE